MTHSAVFVPTRRRTAAIPIVGERFEALDAWRGICALLVVLFHFPTSAFVSQSTFVGSSYLFADFFFVLSGFVMTSAHGGRLGEPGQVARFAIVRFGRVYPLHLVMLAVFFCLELLRLLVPPLRGTGAAPFTGGFGVESLFANLFLLQGLGFENRLTWNAPAWSISALFFTYLLFAVVVFAARARAWIWLLAATVTAPFFLLAFSSRHMDVSYDFGFIRCLYGFSLGALLAWFQHDSIAAARRLLADGRSHPLWTLAEATMIVAIVLFVSLAGDGAAGIAAPFVFALALYLFAHEGGWFSAMLRTPVMLALGALSYSIYMVHSFVQARMFDLAGIVEKRLGFDLVGNVLMGGEPAIGFGPQSSWIGLAAIIAMLGAVVTVSWFTWRFVEMPALAWFRRMAKQV